MQIGRYSVVRKLGAGGMAEVFLARMQGPAGFEKTVAVKRVLDAYAGDPNFLEMFLREARLAARLNHPNIVQVYDFGGSDEEYFIAMEYVDGPSLRQVLTREKERGGRIPLDVAARVIVQACEGLHYAHTAVDPETGGKLGVIHRDISPDNILLTRSGVAKVADFGIARGVEAHTRATTLRGKCAYFAPEQLRSGARIDHRVDVWALGVVLYELITGVRPFTGNSDLLVMQATLFEAHAPPASLREDVPEGLDAIIDRALHKDPELRYPNCQAFAADLETFLGTSDAGRTVGVMQLVQEVAPARHEMTVTPVSAWASALPARGGVPHSQEETQPHRPQDERRGVWALAAVALLSAVVTAGYWAFFSTRATPEVASLQEFTGEAARLEVDSDPPANVFIEGKDRGRTPLRLVDLRPGPKELELREPSVGFRKTTTVNLKVGDNGQLKVEGKKGRLQLVVKPWARVVLNGQEVGHTPLAPIEVWEGRHKITLLDRSGRPVLSDVADVAPGQNALFRRDLSR